MSDTLVAAKQEYTTQLCDILMPLLYKGFKSIWKNCKNNGKSSLKTFQKNLTSVPIWNQDIIDNEYNRIVKETDCNWLDKLIEAVFLSNVKVLSTVRIGKTKTINIPVPETKRFIHQCYIEGARSLWQDPYLIDDRQDILTYSEVKRNEKRMGLAIIDAIEKTISKLIPIQNILESYLNDIDEDQDEEVSGESIVKESNSEELNGYSSDKELLNQDEQEEKSPEPLDYSYKSEPLDNTNDNNSNIDPVDDLFTTEPNVSIQENSEEPQISTGIDDINLNVTEGSTVEDSVINDFNFENGKNITIHTTTAEKESPFFSDSDNE